MYVQDISILCRKNDVSSLRESEEDRLQLIVYPEEEKTWKMVSLERRWRLQWSGRKSYLELKGSRFWIVVLADSNNGIAHALYEFTHVRDSGEQVIPLKVAGQRQLALTIEWRVSETVPDNGIASDEGIPFDVLDACAFYFDRQFRRGGALQFLSNAIEAWRQASLVTPGSDELLGTSKRLSWALYAEYSETGNVDSMRSALEAAKTALGLMGEEDPQLAVILAEIGMYQRELFEIDGQLLLVEESISNLRKAAKIAESGGRSTLPDYLHSLMLSLLRQVDSTGRLSSLEEAISCGTRAVEATNEHDPEYSKRLWDLALAFDSPLGRVRPGSDDEAIRLMEQVIELADGDSQEQRTGLAKQLNKLGTTLVFRFRRTNTASDIRRAVEIHRKAVSLAPEDALPGFLYHLGVALDFSSYHTRDSREIGEAMSAMRRCIALTEEGDPSLPERLRQMAIVLMTSYDSSTELKAMQESILYFRKAVDATPNTSSLLALRLGDLSNALMSRASITGEVLDLDEAVKVRCEEIDALEEGAERLPRALVDLSSILRRRFVMRKDIEDLTRAISACKRAIRVAPEGFWDIAYLHNELGNANHVAFSQLGGLEYLDGAIAAKRKAVSLLPEGHARVPLYLNNLGRSYRAKFQEDSRIETIEEAIQCHKMALSAAVGSKGGVPQWYADLSESLHLKFQITRSKTDIDQAISSLETALTVLPDGDAERPKLEYTLGNLFVKRNGVTRSPKDVKEARRHYRRSALFPFGFTAGRVQAARKWADLALAFDVKSSLEGYGRAIDLLSVFVGMEQSLDLRHQRIAQISGLSRAAAAAALDAGQVAKALDWLERGRCLVWSQLSMLRTPVDDLRLVDGTLATRVIAVSKALETSGGQSGRTRVTLDREVSRGLNTSVDLVVEWKDLISSIRQKPGFEDFLEAETFSIKDLPPSGTVIVINVHETRCDALAFQAAWDAPIHVRLPELSLAKTKRLSDGLRCHLGLGGIRLRGWEVVAGERGGDGEQERTIKRVTRGTTEFKIVDVLRDLWRTVVHPIFDAIGYLGNEVPQRVWWCPTGPLSFLPLHAAGGFRGERDNASDFAISSYSPNIRSLVRQATSGHASKRSPSRFLAVSQPKTPGHSPLPGTSLEVRALMKVLERRGIDAVHLEGKEGTVESCANRLREYNCVHFACHAFQDPKEPLASGFFLHDGRLELSRLMQNDLKTAEIAFLSACQTSTGDNKLSEEAVHLAAGMVAAGFRGVVATMWSIKDQYAPEVATEFYTELTKTSCPGGVDGARAAEALHLAVARLRSNLGDTEDGLLTWVPYVHFGI